MVAAAKIEKGNKVLEVGPGKGVLTEKLLEAGSEVVAVEKDDRLIEFLKEKFTVEIENGTLKLIHADILDLDLSPYLQTTNYKLVANIPYYITGQFLRLFLSGAIKPSCAVLLLQKEVAKRIVARDEKESILSLSVKAYGKPRYIETVQAKYFSPVPKVDSAIILIDEIGPFPSESNENTFFALVKTAFSHKRKMAAGNLKKILDEKEISESFKNCEISSQARAEDIPLEKWICLATFHKDSQLIERHPKG